jgi:hypothetical protein
VNVTTERRGSDGTTTEGTRGHLAPEVAVGRVCGVPWCETCQRFYNPRSVAPDGTCVACGRFIADPEEEAEALSKPPWHFWVLVVALVAYLGWRLIEFLVWLWPG